MSFLHLILAVVAANLLTVAFFGALILLMARTARAPDDPQQRLVRQSPI